MSLHRDVELMIATEGGVNPLSERETQKLVDNVWNRAREDRSKGHNSANYRGRVVSSLDGTTVYWAFADTRPKPMLIITFEASVQEEFWKIASSSPGETEKKHEVVKLTDKLMNIVKKEDMQEDVMRNYIADVKRLGNVEAIARELTQGRGDQPVQRLFEKYPAALRLWQSLPIVHFLNCEHNMDLWNPPPELPASMDKTQEAWAVLCREAMANLLWEHVIFYWVEPTIRLRCWARVRPFVSLESHRADALNIANADRHSVPLMDAEAIPILEEAGADFDDTLMVDMFFKLPNKEVESNVAILRRSNPLANVRSPRDKALVKMVHDVHTLYAYLAQATERTVEVRPASPRSPAGSKTAKRKPWLRDDLPHIVLLNPTKAASVGWRHEREGSMADRKSPVPHDRRGHWRTLQEVEGVREKKMIWVRPAWIGPTNWEHKGRIYKVVQDRKENI